MRILVTGAAGFVGAHLAAHCLERGDAVWGLARPEDDAGRLRALAPAAHLLRGDVLDPASLRAAWAQARPEGCVHLAAQSAVPAAAAAPVATWQVNVIGTLNLYEAARQGGGDGGASRIVFVGSGDVYGVVPSGRLPIRESEPLAPASLYAASKAAADLASEQYARSFGLCIVRARPFNHTGPGQPLGFVAPDVASQIARAERRGVPARVAVGDLSPEKDFSDVRDVVRAYRLLLDRGTPGAAYNVGSGRRVSIRRIVDMLVGLARVSVEIAPDPARARPGPVPSTEADITAIRGATGWEPEIPLARTLADVLEEWRERVTRER